MTERPKIITVGLAPAWDITCDAPGIDWGRHETIDQPMRVPAGKALNISRALAWMGEKSIAAGLWGRGDLLQMHQALSPLRRFVSVRMTPADGTTRQNITIVDTARNRDMHLRSRSTLATGRSLSQLKVDLASLVRAPGSVCVFAGAFSDGALLDNALAAVRVCVKKDVKIAVDVSGPALRRLVNTRCLWLIKPNVDELAELIGRDPIDRPACLLRAAQPLLDKVQMVLISRGQQGALLVTSSGAWHASTASPPRKAIHTVGCGDYLLAGFLKAFTRRLDAVLALETAIKSATARAWGWWQTRNWQQVEKAIAVEIRRL